MPEYVHGDKEYIATIKLGFESTTDDEEGTKTPGRLREPTKDIKQTISKYLYPRMHTWIQEHNDKGRAF